MDCIIEREDLLKKVEYLQSRLEYLERYVYGISKEEMKTAQCVVCGAKAVTVKDNLGTICANYPNCYPHLKNHNALLSSE